MDKSSEHRSHLYVYMSPSSMHSLQPVHYSSPGHVLIVDDMPANVKLLATILGLEGFEISTAATGEEALHLIEAHCPDVVLLDVMMPVMDGLETCRRIRQNPQTQQLPVVMVTALQEVQDRVKALEAGADDFLAKPVEETEVLARVKSLIRAKRGRDELQSAYSGLRRSEELRDNMTQMLVHDLRTPLTGILASLDILGREKAGPLNEVQQEFVTISLRSGKSLLNLVNDLLNVAKLESGHMALNLTSVSIPTLVEEAIEELGHHVRSREIQIERIWNPDLPAVDLDADLVRRVVVNLISNAIKFSPTRSKVKVGIEIDESSPEPRLQMWVSDEGCGIAPEFHQAIWDKFGQAGGRHENNRISTGLGLSFCKLVIEAHGGSIAVDSDAGQGSTFCFYLPVKISPQE